MLELTNFFQQNWNQIGAICKQLPLEHQNALDLLHKGSFCHKNRQQVFCREVYSAHTLRRGWELWLRFVCCCQVRESGNSVFRQAANSAGWRDRFWEGQVINPVLLVLIEPRRSAGIRMRIHLWTQMEAVSHSKRRGGDPDQRKGFVK